MKWLQVKSLFKFLFLQLNISARSLLKWTLWHLFEQINEFVKRARAAKIHAYIISHLRKEMPAMIGKAKTQQRLTDNLEDEFKKVLFILSLCICIHYRMCSYFIYHHTGSKGISSTSWGFSKCWAIQGDLNWLQLWQIREVEA